MSMSVGGKGGGLNAEPNLTPMIDVLLVLLVIFMLIIPMSRKALDVQLPDPTPQDSDAKPNPDQIVLEVLPGGIFAVNKQPKTRAELYPFLKQTYDPRPEKIIFVKGDPQVLYQDVIFAMDAARGAGVKVIGVPPKATPDVESP
ncbi:MAG: biopolymer transporter ExbD [Gemmatimonadaceae bacterium]|nr:biopolymer transporter ExbD [Gemmatimonadaceae bacterium]